MNNGRVCTKLHNEKIYNLNESALIILYSTDTAYRTCKVLIYNSVGLIFPVRTAQ